MSLLLARAAVNDANIHFDRLYSYLIPAQLVGKVYPGSMVLVPFGRGNKARMAVVLAVEEAEETDAPQRLKSLYDAAPEEARLTPDLLELVRFLKERTFCTWFEAVKAVIPYGAQLLLAGSIAKLSPLSIAGNNWYCMLLAVAAVFAILFGIPYDQIQLSGDWKQNELY